MNFSTLLICYVFCYAHIMVGIKYIPIFLYNLNEIRDVVVIIHVFFHLFFSYRSSGHYVLTHVVSQLFKMPIPRHIARQIPKFRIRISIREWALNGHF